VWHTVRASDKAGHGVRTGREVERDLLRTPRIDQARAARRGKHASGMLRPACSQLVCELLVRNPRVQPQQLRVMRLLAAIRHAQGDATGWQRVGDAEREI
jgi:hypothetical protein